MPMHACVAVCVRRFRVRPLSEGTSPCKICTAVAVKAQSIKIQKKRKFRTPGDGMRRALDGKCSTENVGLESLSANALPSPMPMHACGAVYVRRFRVRPLSEGTWWVDGAVGWSSRPKFSLFSLLSAVSSKKSHRAYLLIGCCAP